VGEWFGEWEETVKILAGWLQEGKLKYKESIVNGIENSPKAFIGLLRGENFGKQLIKVSEPE
jgi:NADPH-dependent curcumin reductase CurA